MDYIVFDKDMLIEIENVTNARSGNIVDQLVDIRKEQNKTQQDLANITGMCRANISRIEQKNYTPTLEVLMRYATALGYEVDISLKKKE